MNRATAKRMTDSDSQHLTTIAWARGEWSQHKGKYSREHLWHFAGGAKLKASDSMAPEGYRDKVRLNPENLFVATVASAHMLSWLHVAFGMGVEIDSYVDAAEGVMTALPDGVYWISEVILTPKITCSAGYEVTPAAIAHIHELAQKDSFIAHSIKTKVTVRAVL
jgi:organic hydroperoxide reductase OsmC/OhrA